MHDKTKKQAAVHKQNLVLASASVLVCETHDYLHFVAGTSVVASLSVPSVLFLAGFVLL